MWAVERNYRAVGVEVVVGRGELRVGVQRCAGVPGAAEHVLLLGDGHPVPELDEHPDQPDDLIAAARGPGGLAGGARLDPDQPVHASAWTVSGLAIPSLKPIRLRGVPGGPGRAGEAVDAPAHLHAAAGVPGDVAECVQDRVRAARAELEAQVAAALSGVEVVVGERVIAMRPAGLRVARPYRSSNRVDPTPTVTVRPSGTTVGPSIPESDGGPPIPTCGGTPPVVRKRARAVRVRSRSVSSPGSPRSRRRTARWSAAAAGAGCPPGARRGTAPPAAVPPPGRRRGPGPGRTRPGSAVGVPGPGARRDAGHGPGDSGTERATQEGAARRPSRLTGRRRHGLARHGLARRARAGQARAGQARAGQAGLARHGLARHGLARHGLARGGHHDCRGSVMDATGASSCRICPAAASICSRWAALSLATDVQLPSGRWVSLTRRSSRSSPEYTAGRPG